MARRGRCSRGPCRSLTLLNLPAWLVHFLSFMRNHRVPMTEQPPLAVARTNARILVLAYARRPLRTGYTSKYRRDPFPALQRLHTRCQPTSIPLLNLLCAALCRTRTFPTQSQNPLPGPGRRRAFPRQRHTSAPKARRTRRACVALRLGRCSALRGAAAAAQHLSTTAAGALITDARILLGVRR